MRLFQSARASFLLRNGYREDGTDPSKMTRDELTDLIANYKRRKDGIST